MNVLNIPHVNPDRIMASLLLIFTTKTPRTQISAIVLSTDLFLGE
jgi:hypothetical protein